MERRLPNRARWHEATTTTFRRFYSPSAGSSLPSSRTTSLPLLPLCLRVFSLLVQGLLSNGFKLCAPAQRRLRVSFVPCNLVPLLGWCSSEHEMVLAYEFMPNGNLDGALHTQGGATLPWEARFGAVLGVASALTLHDECEHRILHRDVKSSNVLLDAEFNAQLGDFGLARVVSHGGVPLATQPAGTLGYLAPEYVHSGVASERSDVYSFGVLAFEVATGRRPTEKGTAVFDLVWGLWGRRRLVDAADQWLQGRFVEEEMRRILLVGQCCVHPDCWKRPGMRRVLRMLDATAPMTMVPDKKPAVVLKSPLNQTSSINTVDTKNTAFYSCR